MKLIKTRWLAVFCLAAIMALPAAALAADKDAGDKGKEKKQAVKLSEEDQKKYDLAFEKALAHYEKAQLLYEKKNLEKTAKELESIIALEYPKAAAGADGPLMQLDMRSFLGEIYLELGKGKEAVEVLKKGLEKAPEISTQAYQLHMTLGHVYKEMKKVDDALEAFDKAEKINEALLKEEEKAKKKEAGAEK